jgi:DNA-binding MarR family transcriptional regulator
MLYTKLPHLAYLSHSSSKETMLMSEKTDREEKEKLLNLLHPAIESFHYKVKQVHKETEQLADGQLFLLMLLNRYHVCKASDLANQIGITSGAITGISDKLVHLGLIRRERSEEDRRVVLLSLTEAGRKMLEDIRLRRMQRLSGMLAQLSVEELSHAVDIFRKLNVILETGRQA